MLTDQFGVSIFSNEILLTVVDGPLIVEQPQSIEINTGEIGKFKIVAEGENLTYQWQKNEGTSWQNITGANDKTFFITEEGDYRCVVTDMYDNKILSDTATLKVFTSSIITRQLENVNVPVGTSVTWEIDSSDVGAKFQWQYCHAKTLKWYNFSNSTGKTLTRKVPATWDGRSVAL